MIKVIVQRRVKNLGDAWTLLRELRMAAMQHGGYVSGETLTEIGNRKTVITISTWQDINSWKSWEKSKERAELYKKIQPLLSGKPTATVYEILGSGK